VFDAALTIGAGLVAVFLAVNAERRSLEDIARPLTARQRPADTVVCLRGRASQRSREGAGRRSARPLPLSRDP